MRSPDFHPDGVAIGRGDMQDRFIGDGITIRIPPPFVGGKQIFLFGGENLFSQILHRAHCIYLTVIDAEFDGDTFFSELSANWKLISEEKHLPDEKNAYAYSFQLLENSHRN